MLTLPSLVSGRFAARKKVWDVELTITETAEGNEDSIGSVFVIAPRQSRDKSGMCKIGRSTGDDFKGSKGVSLPKDFSVSTWHGKVRGETTRITCALATQRQRSIVYSPIHHNPFVHCFSFAFEHRITWSLCCVLYAVHICAGHCVLHRLEHQERLATQWVSGERGLIDMCTESTRMNRGCCLMCCA